MSINQIIYDFYDKNIEQFREVNSKVKIIEELIISIENQRKEYEFKDGQYETWLVEIDNLEKRLEVTKNSLRSILDSLIEFYKLIPLEKSVFDYRKLRFEKNHGCISIKVEKDDFLVSQSYKDVEKFELDKAMAFLE